MNRLASSGFGPFRFPAPARHGRLYDAGCAVGDQNLNGGGIRDARQVAVADHELGNIEPGEVGDEAGRLGGRVVECRRAAGRDIEQRPLVAERVAIGVAGA